MTARHPPVSAASGRERSDTQIRIGESASTFVRRALIVKDAASLASVGSIAIPFAPDDQRVPLHAIRILRDEQTIDQTKSLPIRFLQREMGLEQGSIAVRSPRRFS